MTFQFYRLRKVELAGARLHLAFGGPAPAVTNGPTSRMFFLFPFFPTLIMANATTPSATKRYRISFQIRDGDNEYYKDTIMDCDHEPSEEEQTRHVFEQYAIYDSENELAAAWPEVWQQCQENNGHLEDLGGDYRIITDIGIEPEPGEMLQLKAVNAELLAALKGLSGSMCMAEEAEHRLDCDDADTCTLCTARRAIAKAEGLPQPSL